MSEKKYSTESVLSLVRGIEEAVRGTILRGPEDRKALQILISSYLNGITTEIESQRNI